MPRTILIAEDDPVDMEMLRRALKAAGVRNPVETVSSGRELTQHLTRIAGFKDRAQHPLPGLLFLDLHLSDMSGLDILRFIRYDTDLSGMAVVVLSGAVSGTQIAEAEAIGAECILMKPERHEELRAMIAGLNDTLAQRGAEPALQID